MTPATALAYVLLMFSAAPRPISHRHGHPDAIPAAAPSAEPVALPLYSSAVSAGFPSPADDFLERRLDPSALLVKRPASTFFVRAAGRSMESLIHDGDILVVDRGIDPAAGDVVVAVVEGGLTVKMLSGGPSQGWRLQPVDPDFPTIPVDPEEGVAIWGVVTFALTALCQR